MKPAPSDWPRISSAICYQDASRAIDWLCDAFGFEVRLKVEGENGRIEHSELTFGEGLIMVAQEDLTSDRHLKAVLRSPRSLDGKNTQSLMFFVDDVDEPTLQDYGNEYWADRSYGALDPEGHIWWIVQRVRNAPGH